MCGIAGILDFGRQSNFDGYSALTRMLDNLSHRGPDNRGEEVIKGIKGTRLWLGHQRLSIIDLSSICLARLKTSLPRFVIVYLRSDLFNATSDCLSNFLK